MLTYTSEMRSVMDSISFTDDDFIEKIIAVGTMFRPFSDAMDSFIIAHGFVGNIEDVDAKVSFIKNAFKDAGMKPPREIMKWYEGQPIRRDTGFLICFAFGLNRFETDDFFKRFFARERGFDCHNLKEAVYYYCLSNDLAYADALEILEKIHANPTVQADDREVVYTSAIIEDLNNIGSKEELISYLSNNADMFMNSNLTAYAIIQRMWIRMVNNDGLLRQERNTLPSIQDDLAIGVKVPISSGLNMSVPEAYIALFQLDKSQVARLNTQKASIKPILKSMHSHVEDCFPNEQGIDRILRNDYSVNYETVRKWLVLLSFYTFWARVAIEERGDYEALPEDRKRCISSMNNFLVEAGYSELYEGNPYDWLFFYAIGDDYPLETFRWIWTFLMDKALGV